MGYKPVTNHLLSSWDIIVQFSTNSPNSEPMAVCKLRRLKMLTRNQNRSSQRTSPYSLLKQSFLGDKVTTQLTTQSDPKWSVLDLILFILHHVWDGQPIHESMSKYEGYVQEPFSWHLPTHLSFEIVCCDWITQILSWTIAINPLWDEIAS